MALRAPQPQDDIEPEDELPPLVVFSPEEGRAIFDEAVRRAMGYSGEEFIRRWEAGEFANIPDDAEHRHIIELGLMLPLALQAGSSSGRRVPR
jgi:hypothetical protein